MSFSSLSTKTGRFLWGSIGLYLSSFILPFLDDSTGIEFFIKGIKVLIEGKLELQFLPYFVSFYIPFFTFPVFVVFCWRASGKRKWYWVNSLLLMVSQPILLYRLIETINIRALDDPHLIGYGVWLLAQILLTVALYYKENPIDPTNDLSQHLIEDVP